MRHQQLLLWSLLIVFVTSAIAINNYSINNKVLRIGEIESFMERIMKTNLINNEFSYGEACFSVGINSKREVEWFRVLTVDKKKLEVVHFKVGRGYSISGQGWVSERDYIEYKDINISEIEEFCQMIIDRFSLYKKIPRAGLLTIDLSGRLNEAAYFHYDPEDESNAYRYDEKNKDFVLIEEDLMLDEGTYRFILYNNPENNGRRGDKMMTIYRKFNN